MLSEQSKPSNQTGSIESIAQEFKMPIYDVVQLYEGQMGELAVNAHIRNFLPIFAARNVREMLIQRSTEKQSPTP